MNVSEQIADARRLTMRKHLAELAIWCAEKSKIDFIDTEKALDDLDTKYQNIIEQLKKAESII